MKKIVNIITSLAYITFTISATSLHDIVKDNDSDLLQQTISTIAQKEGLSATLEKINETDSAGLTPLDYSARHKDLKAATILINNGADINRKKSLTPPPIYYAAINENENMIKLLMKMGVDINSTNASTLTPFCFAIRDNQIIAALILLKYGANKNVYVWNSKAQPMHIAAQFNHPDMIKLLVGMGCSVNSKDLDGRTPLDYAAFCNSTAAIKTLINYKASVTIKNKNGNTPIFTALIKNNPQATEELLKVSPLYIINDLGNNILHCAAKHENPTLLAKIIHQMGSKSSFFIKAINNDGRTPIHVAAFYGATKNLEILINNGGDVNKKINIPILAQYCKNKIYGDTALYLALQQGYEETALTLIKNGAHVNEPVQRDFKVKDRVFVDEFFTTHLYKASEQDFPKITLTMLSYGADPNSKDSYSRKNPMELATETAQLLQSFVQSKTSFLYCKNKEDFFKTIDLKNQQLLKYFIYEASNREDTKTLQIVTKLLPKKFDLQTLWRFQISRNIIPLVPYFLSQLIESPKDLHWLWTKKISQKKLSKHQLFLQKSYETARTQNKKQFCKAVINCGMILHNTRIKNSKKTLPNEVMRNILSYWNYTPVQKKSACSIM